MFLQYILYSHSWQVGQVGTSLLLGRAPPCEINSEICLHAWLLACVLVTGPYMVKYKPKVH